ncbi:MAG: Glycosyl transferase family 11 [Parcubacteria group bacterium ADurb.Bin316]|nr:MAG: Glycosyl transferase family 11 [Parcubacteria group bacterium ADurb.Bin316]
MIIIRLSGGLGNQMFQYALGRYLSLKNNELLRFDINAIKNGIRKYSLNNFTVVGEISVDKDYKKINIPNMHRMNFRTRLRRRLFRLHEKNKSIYDRKIIIEPNFNFCQDILKIKNNCYLSGDWQSEKYFIESEDVIRKDLTLKNELSDLSKQWIGKIESCASVSLHIRRGDYVSNPKTNQFHGTCDLAYYQRAISAIAKKINNPEFFVFSDDIEWAKNNLKIDYPIYFVSDKNIPDYEELIIMSKCKYNIIANSSFSWWGAWLNNNPDKIVIAPQKWFNAPTDTSDLIPEKWIRL